MLVLLTQALHADPADLRPAEIFCGGLVLQRDAAVPVWGWAAPGARITARFAGQEKHAPAGPDGAWRLTLDPMPASSEPRVLTIGDGRRETNIVNVLVGEVWLCSGQSNMVYPFGNTPPGFSTDYPLIREFTVPRSIALEPQTMFRAPRAMAGHAFMETKHWIACTPATASRFSGVGLYAAIEMFKTLQVPIGIVNASFNGSGALLWIPEGVLRQDPRFDADLAEAKEELRRYHAAIGEYERDQALFMHMKEEMDAAGDAASAFRDVPDRGLQDGWMKPDCDVADWPKLTWGWTHGRPVYIWDGDSIIWFRMLCAQIKPGGDVTLRGGEFRNCQVRFFFNGKELEPAKTSADGLNEYVIKRADIAADSGWLAIRAFSNRKLACMRQVPSSDNMLVLATPHGVSRVSECGQAATFRLAGHKYPPKGLAVYPGTRYNAMLNPIVPFAIQGFLWYQGESECFQGLRQTRLYAQTLPLLIQTWRNAWGGGDRPFVVVQLAGHGYDPSRSFLMEMRESQKAALKLPRTAVSPSMDIREPGNVHPGNKFDIGTRAGRAALAVAYGKDVACSGPAFREMKVDGSRARIFFDHAEGGLVLGEKTGLAPVKFLPDTRVPHFLIAGPDRSFVPAEAVLETDTVRVWSDAVPQPAAVRYAWTNMPGNPLLYNRAGLPACSFRTDDGDIRPE